MKVALMFPGQGSQRVGMGKSLWESDPGGKAVFAEADEALGRSISTLCFEGPEEDLRLTANTQPAILTTSIACLKALERAGVKAEFVAGHSLGEYSALVAAGSLNLADAVRLVEQRGRFMQDAVPPDVGAMAAIMGSDYETVAAACAEAAGSESVCAPCNINAASQIVIGGHRAAVENAVNLLKERGAKKTVMLAVSAPFHCDLMQPAADRLKPVLEQTAFSDLDIPLVTNVDARIIRSGDEARDALLRQVASPVRWSDSVKLLLDEGVGLFIEVGPGKVLSGLLRQIDRQARALNVEDVDSLQAALAVLN